jgi:hypothetical protein
MQNATEKRMPRQPDSKGYIYLYFHLQLPAIVATVASRNCHSLRADSSTKHQAPSTKHQAPSTKHQAPSTKHQEPRTKNQEPRTKNQETHKSGADKSRGQKALPRKRSRRDQAVQSCPVRVRPFSSPSLATRQCEMIDNMERHEGEG